MTALTRFRTDADIPDGDAALSALLAAVLAAPANLWRAVASRIEERQAVMRLARMNPRLVRDMGFDPDAVNGAMTSAWDDVPARPRYPNV